MRNTVTVSQQFPTWAEAYEAKERLAEEHGFDQHGIERIEIERFGGKFELLVRTDEFHRDEIEHLLRSSGTMFNPPTRPRPRGWSSATPMVLLGSAAVAGIAVYALLAPRQRQAWSKALTSPFTARPGRESQAGAPRATAAAGTPMFTLEANGRAIAVTKGNESEARAIFEGAEFKDKLRTMQSDGEPLWNGAGSCRIRPATPAEVRAFVQYAETLGFEDEEEGEIILYVRPIDGTEEFDETQDG